MKTFNQTAIDHAIELDRLRAVNAELLAALNYLEVSTMPRGQWEQPGVCSFVRAALALAKGE